MRPFSAFANFDGCWLNASSHFGGSHNCTNGASYAHTQRNHRANSHRDGCSISNAGLAG